MLKNKSASQEPKKYIKPPLKVANKLHSKYLKIKKKSGLFSASVLLLGALSVGQKCAKQNIVSSDKKEDKKEQSSPSLDNGKKVDTKVYEQASKKIGQLRDKIDVKKKVSEPTDRFDDFFKNLVGQEGGYGTNDEKEIKKLRAKGVKVSKIDQPTNFGVTQITLQNLKKDHPALYKNIDHVRDLTLDKVKGIYSKHFYNQYKINQVKDDLLAEQMFDIMSNHSYKTGKEKFIIASINSVEKMNNKNHKDKSFKNWEEIVGHINSLNGLETAQLNLQIATTRDSFMNDGRVKEFGGLLKRSENFVNSSQKQLERFQKNEDEKSLVQKVRDFIKSKFKD